MTAVHIVVAMKPIEGNYAGNAIELGVAGINVDGCRIRTADALGGGRLRGPTDMSSTCGDDTWDRPWMHDGEKREEYAKMTASKVAKAEAQGRWPANVIHDGSDEVTEQFPYTVSGKPCGIRRGVKTRNPSDRSFNDCPQDSLLTGFGDEGSASRFFKECKV